MNYKFEIGDIVKSKAYPTLTLTILYPDTPRSYPNYKVKSNTGYEFYQPESNLYVEEIPLMEGTMGALNNLTILK